MKSSDTLKEIAPALTKAQAEFKAVAKSGENKFDRYSYANLEDYVRAVKPVLASHGLSVLTSVEEVVAMDDRTTKNGGAEHVARVRLAVRILHNSGEWLEASAWGEGQDRSDKAVYKATTGARKYALASALGLATTDDPEHDEPAPGAKQAPPPARKAERDGLEDPKAFRRALHAAFKSRGFVATDEQRAVAAICKGCGVEAVDGLGLELRHKVLADVGEGKTDKYREKPTEAPTA